MADEPDDATIRQWAEASLHPESGPGEKAKAEIIYWQLKAQFDATKAQRESIAVQRAATEAQKLAAVAETRAADASER